MAFRPMRRNRQQLSHEQSEAVLLRNTAGVLAVNGDDGYPYAVPLSYVYHAGGIFFHTAKSGHKLDAIEKDPRVSFAVIDEDTIVDSEFTTYFRSVVAFGKASVVTDEAARREAYLALSAKYAPAQGPDAAEGCFQRSGANAPIVRIDIEHMTGKEAIELVRARQGESGNNG